jgi:hypothetical protein
LKGWSLLLHYSKGLKVSSRKIARTLKKAGIPASSRGCSQIEIMDELKEATKHYYSLKKTDKQLRATHLERLASAMASKGNLKRENILKQLRLKESQ